MSTEKIILCLALLGSVGWLITFAILITAFSLGLVKVQFRALTGLFDKAAPKASEKDEVLARALKLIEDQTLVVESLKDDLAAVHHRLQLADAAAVPAPQAPAEPVTKPVRQRTRKSAAAAPASEAVATPAGVPAGASMGGLLPGMPDEFPPAGDLVPHAAHMGPETFAVLA